MASEMATALQKTEEKNAEKPNTDLRSGSGLFFEAPLTRPFEGYSYLKKEWIDQQDNIESVTFSCTYGKLNLPANWDKLESHVMMPEWGSSPLRRTWIVRLPTHLGPDEKYLFHYFFQVQFQDGSDKVSDTFTELICPRQIEYIDHSGSLTNVRLHWSINGWSYPQDTEFEVDGIEWGSDFSVSQAQYRAGDKLYARGRAALIARIPVPRVFRTLIWAPRGATINYCFNLISTDAEGQATERWDNNSARNYKITL